MLKGEGVASPKGRQAQARRSEQVLYPNFTSYLNLKKIRTFLK